MSALSLNLIFHWSSTTAAATNNTVAWPTLNLFTFGSTLHLIQLLSPHELLDTIHLLEVYLSHLEDLDTKAILPLGTDARASEYDEDDDEQKEELLEEKMMDPEFQMLIDELAKLDLNEASVNIHSMFAQTQKDHQADSSVSNDDEDPIEITVENIKFKVDDIHIAEEFREQLRAAQYEKNIFLAISNASEQIYMDVHDALMHYYPSCEIYSHDKIKRVIQDLSGIDSMVIVTHVFSIQDSLQRLI
ncbi:hypothetical protein A0H81_02819 [Grifola frondosa]|uniref:Uncharacterized protein n=1 Tax=Grifola frondosa TaxID=5627 RepID=A0A1C7MMC8_GRIFR|nr:hypothetical protein A0H81_02819 [Grifola frondosa]